MIKKLRKIMHICIGVLTLTLGIIGLILPIVNGTALIIIGLIVLSFESTYIEKKLINLTERHELLHKWHIRLDRFLRKVFRQ
jgi:uncharacterized membrane protein YbaN (DUF454 family)